MSPLAAAQSPSLFPLMNNRDRLTELTLAQEDVHLLDWLLKLWENRTNLKSILKVHKWLLCADVWELKDAFPEVTPFRPKAPHAHQYAVNVDVHAFAHVPFRYLNNGDKNSQHC